MPQSFRPLNLEEECILLARGEETTTPQAVRASNSRVPGVHVHQENTQFSTDQLMECQLQMHEVAQKLVSTPLFSFQDLKLSTKDIIAILEDTLNTTLVLYQSLIHMLQKSHPTPWRDIGLAHVLKMAFVIWSLVLTWLN
jgi:hypothetical protein